MACEGLLLNIELVLGPQMKGPFIIGDFASWRVELDPPGKVDRYSLRRGRLPSLRCGWRK